MVLIFIRNDRFVDAPGNSKFGIVPCYAALFGRIVEVIAFIEKLGGFRQNKESVGEAWRDVDHLLVIRGEHCAERLSEIGRTPPDIDDYVQNMTADNAAQFCLGMTQLIMETAQGSLRGF